MKTELKIAQEANLPEALPQVRRIRGKWELLLSLSGLFSLLYFVTAQPIAQSDPVSRNFFGLVAAFASEGSPYLDHFVTSPTGGFLTSAEDAPNLAYFNGHYFADSLPGAAWLAVPFYRLGSLFGSAGPAAFVLFGTALAGAACLLVFYAICRRLGSAHPSALWGTLLLGLASALWREAGRVAPGVFSLLLFGLALLLALVPLPRDEQVESVRLRWGRACLLGFLLGYAGVVDLPNLLWTPLFVAYLVVQRRVTLPRLGVLGLAWGVGLLPLAIYNWLAFGRPWTFVYGFLINQPDQRSLAGQFLNGFSPRNAWDVLFGPGRAMLGIFVLLFGIWGLCALYGQRGKRYETIFLAGLIIISFVVALLRANNGGERVDFGLAMLLPLAIGAAVWHERFMFLTRYEQRSIPRLALVGCAAYYLIAWPRVWPNPDGVIYLLPLVGIIGLVVAVWLLIPRLGNWPRGFALTLVILLFSLFAANPDGLGANRPVFVEAGANNLLLNGNLTCENQIVAGWYLNEQPLACPFTPTFIKSGAKFTSYKVPVQGGKLYTVAFAGQIDGQLDWLWLDDGHEPVVVKGGKFTEVSSQPLLVDGEFKAAKASPPGAAYLQLIFKATPSLAESGGLSNLRLWDDGVRVEPLKNYARAALSFTFDWESAMGGLVHSKGGTPSQKSDEAEFGLAISEENIHLAVADAERRGLAMRRGADYLLEVFGKFDIRGTFYANGYNLLDGNREKQTFAGNPTYKWAAPKNRWESDYWATHAWYGLDPFADYQSQPAWYFGDQTDRLSKAGQDIQSHTFGHLYVRGVSRQELQTDTEFFQRYARLKKLPAVRHFAFPWTSSNSVTEEIYNVLGDYGFQSITRLYYTDQFIKQTDGALVFDNGKRTNQNAIDYQTFAGPANPYYYLSRSKKDSRLYILHDYYMTPGDKSEAAAKGLIDALLQRRGYGSIWTHPESIVEASDQAQWLRVISYAAEKREAGLWVDSVANLLQHRLDTAKIGVKTSWRATSNNGKQATLTVTNSAATKVDGLTLTLPAPLKSATGGASFKGSQLLLPALASGQTISIEIEF